MRKFVPSLQISRKLTQRLLKFSSSVSNDKSVQLHKHSLTSPEEYWGSISRDIHWSKSPDVILDVSNPPFYRWFQGGQLNTCYNCVDRHVEGGFGDELAIIYDSPVTNTIRKITYKELSQNVNTFAGLLVEQGIEKGDRVMIYMPNSPEAVIAVRCNHIYL
jgi:propionyl-CoA synthetase